MSNEADADSALRTAIRERTNLKQPAMIRAKLAPVQVRTERFQAVLSGSTSANWLANRPA